jgi:hypothetical protein
MKSLKWNNILVKNPISLLKKSKIFWALGFIVSVISLCETQGIVAPFTKNPHSFILARWPMHAVPCLLSLVPETATHHSHYLRTQDMEQPHSFQAISLWIHKQFFSDKQEKFSLFLVTPCEISAFLSYIDHTIRCGLFFLMDYGPCSFVFKPTTPFKERNFLGICFFRDSLSKKISCLEAPCIKVVTGRDNKILSIYPVTLSFPKSLSQKDFEEIVKTLLSSSCAH